MITREEDFRAWWHKFECKHPKAKRRLPVCFDQIVDLQERNAHVLELNQLHYLNKVDTAEDERAFIICFLKGFWKYHKSRADKIND